jgi:hypothetical protein
MDEHSSVLARVRVLVNYGSSTAAVQSRRNCTAAARLTDGNINLTGPYGCAVGGFHLHEQKQCSNFVPRLSILKTKTASHRCYLSVNQLLKAQLRACNDDAVRSGSIVG